MGCWGSPTETGGPAYGKKSHDSRGPGEAPGVPAEGGQATISFLPWLTSVCRVLQQLKQVCFLSPEVERYYKKYPSNTTYCLLSLIANQELCEVFCIH